MDSKREESHAKGMIDKEVKSMGRNPMNTKEMKIFVGIENAHLHEELAKMKVKIGVMEHRCEML